MGLHWSVSALHALTSNTSIHTAPSPPHSDLSRLSVLRALERGHAKKHHFVTRAWVEACLREQALLSERSYEPQDPP